MEYVGWYILVGRCADTRAFEDAENDEFLTEDAKADWDDYETSSTSLLIKFSNSDDGDENSSDVIPRCR